MTVLSGCCSDFKCVSARIRFCGSACFALAEGGSPTRAPFLELLLRCRMADDLGHVESHVAGLKHSRPPVSVEMLPQKKYFRQRAHSNPIADHILDYPSTPDQFDWHQLFPAKSDGSPAEKPQLGPEESSSEPASKRLKCQGTSKHVNFVDVGCGYGGLLVELSPMFPDKLILGMEIRVKVSTYVQERIKALRLQHSNVDPGYNNIACIRSNAMKHMPNFFGKGQVEKMFFLFPDPHFKKQKHKWRIISPQLLAEYAYVLAIGARVYLATDVKDLYDWMVGHFNDHPLFQSLDSVAMKEDAVVDKLFDSTEEGKKVTRNGGQKFIAVYVRIDDPYNSQ